ncbi:unnamed protein product [Nezara viridula]|uniref:Uncharacterized protein n=1 Tax=Nezara viridula TaxID=85310 RepID=A0A9P0EAB7_NEZVI|nr:unnamed protein product [Nezara viridula]
MMYGRISLDANANLHFSTCCSIKHICA